MKKGHSSQRRLLADPCADPVAWARDRYDLLWMDIDIFSRFQKTDVYPLDVPVKPWGNVNLCIAGAGWYAVFDYPRALEFVARIDAVAASSPPQLVKRLKNNAYCHMVRNLAVRGELERARECRARMTAPYSDEDECIEFCSRYETALRAAADKEKDPRSADSAKQDNT